VIVPDLARVDPPPLVEPELLGSFLALDVVPSGRTALAILGGSGVFAGRGVWNDLNGLTAYQTRTGFDARGYKARGVVNMRGLEDSDERTG
jgi:hypothetical protein